MSTTYGPQPPNRLLYPLKHHDAAKRKNISISDARIPTPIKIYANAAYYPNWHVYRNRFPSDLRLDMISHVFYAFASVERTGTVMLGDPWADDEIEINGTRGCLRVCGQLKSKYGYLKVLLSIGGFNNCPEVFAVVAGSSEARNTFAMTAKQLVLEYDLDGIDLNWRYPSGPDEVSNYILLLQCLRQYLPSPRFTLTTILPFSDAGFGNCRLAEVSNVVDLINVMSFDAVGPWSSSSGYHSQVYSSPQETNMMTPKSCDQIIRHVLLKGVCPEKLLLGVPCYGWSFLGTNDIKQTHSGLGGEDGRFEYWELPRADAVEHVDHENGAAYCTGGDGGFVTYDNPQIVKMKANLVKEQALGGLFYWPGSSDGQGNRSLVHCGYLNLHFVDSFMGRPGHILQIWYNPKPGRLLFLSIPKLETK